MFKFYTYIYLRTGIKCERYIRMPFRLCFIAIKTLLTLLRVTILVFVALILPIEPLSLTLANATDIQHNLTCAELVATASVSKYDQARGIRWTSIENKFEQQWDMYENTEGEAWRFSKERIGDRAYSLLQPQYLAGKNYLDAGCGRGKNITSLQKKGITNAVGLDISLSRGQLAKPYFFLGDIRKTGFASKTFHVVTSAYNVFAYPETLAFRSQALQELARVTKSGGYIVITPYRALTARASQPLPSFQGQNNLWGEMGRRLDTKLSSAKREIDLLIFNNSTLFVVGLHTATNGEVTVLLQKK